MVYRWKEVHWLVWFIKDLRNAVKYHIPYYTVAASLIRSWIKPLKAQEKHCFIKNTLWDRVVSSWVLYTLCTSCFYIFFEVWLSNKNWIYLRQKMWCFDTGIHCKMISTIKLITIYITAHSYHGFVCGEILKSTHLPTFKYKIHYQCICIISLGRNGSYIHLMGMIIIQQLYI